jgi:hypothetical protein
MSKSATRLKKATIWRCGEFSGPFLTTFWVIWLSGVITVGSGKEGKVVRKNEWKRWEKRRKEKDEKDEKNTKNEEKS